jgi:hypothetical protein
MVNTKIEEVVEGVFVTEEVVSIMLLMPLWGAVTNCEVLIVYSRIGLAPWRMLRLCLACEKRKARGRDAGTE